MLQIEDTSIDVSLRLGSEALTVQIPAENAQIHDKALDEKREPKPMRV